MSSHAHVAAGHRIAGAPISWGVCEVAGWGYQLPADRVLTEMRQLGLLATERGPEGFLPGDPVAMAAVLSRHGLQTVVGGADPAELARQSAARIAHLRGSGYDGWFTLEHEVLDA